MYATYKNTHYDHD